MFEAKIDAAQRALAQGHFEEAVRAALQVLEAEPNNVRAGILAGIAAARLGQTVLAIQRLKHVVRLDSSQWEALNWLCVLLLQSGEASHAILCGRKACELRPDSAECQSNFGFSLLNRWQYPEAMECFKRAIALDPNMATAHHNYGVTLERLGRAAEAEAAYLRAAELDPVAPNPLVSLGALYRKMDRLADSDAAFRKAERRVAGSAKGMADLGKALVEEGNLVQAEAVLERLLSFDRSSADTLTRLGHIRQQLGRFDEAIGCFEKALQLNPDSADAYFEVSRCRRITKEDENLVERMEILASNPNLTQRDFRQIHYALGKAYDDRQEYERAYPHFKAANDSVLTAQHGLRLNREALEAGVSQIVGTFGQKFFSDHRNLGSESELPVLIVGMIRSGTTLVEQILSSHPDVGAGGEQVYLLENGAVLHPTQGVIPDRVRSVAANYLRLLTGIAPLKHRVTDKMPNNYIMLGLVHLLFPKARIVHCRRSPGDTCLSIYTTPLGDVLNFAHDPEDIVYNYRQYQRLMAHWRAVLPASAFMEVDYESLVSDREPVVRDLLAFCGLSWHDACLRHQDRGGAVVTPSNWQVRQPIYKTSLRRWERYEPWLPQYAALERENMTRD